jgi:hypothetical protein
VINRYTPVVTWGKIASWGVAAAVTAAFWPALSQAPVPAPAGDPAAGYAPITTGRGMCLDDEAGVGTTAASDPGTFTTTATMAAWPGCAAVTPVRGPGALIMAWFGRQAS